MHMGSKTPFSDLTKCGPGPHQTTGKFDVLPENYAHDDKVERSRNGRSFQVDARKRCLIR